VNRYDFIQFPCLYQLLNVRVRTWNVSCKLVSDLCFSTPSHIDEESHKRIRRLSRKAREAELEKQDRRRTLLPSPPVHAHSVSLRPTPPTLRPRAAQHSDSPNRQHTPQPVIRATITQTPSRPQPVIRPRFMLHSHSPVGQQSAQPPLSTHNGQGLVESVQRVELGPVQDIPTSISLVRGVREQ